MMVTRLLEIITGIVVFKCGRKIEVKCFGNCSIVCSEIAILLLFGQNAFTVTDKRTGAGENGMEWNRDVPNGIYLNFKLNCKKKKRAYLVRSLDKPQ